MLMQFEDPRSREMSYSMGTRPHIQMCVYVMVGMMLGSGLRDSSAPSEVETVDLNFDSNKSNMKSVPSFKKYIMESYFERSESLLDSDFQEFIVHEFPFGLCKVPPDNVSLGLRLSVRNHSLDGEGSHRRLSSSIRFNILPETISELSGRSCEVTIIERLPSGVFADPFELQHLHQRGVFTDIAVFGETNLELPSVVTNRSAVEIHMNVESNILHKKESEIKIELPLHARYSPLDDSGYTKIEFVYPDLFVRCGIDAGKSHDESCLFFPAADSSIEPKTGAVVWSVPSGKEAHARIVSVVTFLCALFSTLLIVWTSIYHSDIMLFKTLKQS